ncbi:MAG: phospholipase effector Tle1 domain-containing protein, partial [Mariprofundus sp.]
MALYAFDGTWNEDEEEGVSEHETNVVKFRDIYEGPVEYRAGVGTRYGAVGKVLGGVFGMGGQSRIEEMYNALKENWQRGDQVIDIIGFSRGAALAMHFANILGQEGIKLDDGSVVKPDIRFLGVWDIVGSFGIPIDFIINFHDINLGFIIDKVPDCVQHCFHAMALDERRQTFDVTRLDVGNANPHVEEMWFRGVHSDVGGGNDNIARSNIALQWMLKHAGACGLPVKQAAIDLVARATNSMAPISENLDVIQDPRRTVHATDIWHPTAVAKDLNVGDAFTFPVRAKDHYNWSGVALKQGASYRFDIAADQKWMDASISCGPEGWKSEDLPWYKEVVITQFENSRRCPEADWFELVGSVGDNGDQFFRIGQGGDAHIYQARQDGDLYTFANDLRSKYN